MRIRSLLLTLACLFMLSIFAHASDMKLITLKDGSTIKGEILSFSQGQYAIKTNHLGKITVNNEDIVSIKSFGSKIQSTSNLKNEVEDIQGIISKDPQIMQEIFALLEDPQVIQLLADPALINDVQSMDENRIRSNPALQQLIENKKVRQLMTEIQQKLPQQ